MHLCSPKTTLISLENPASKPLSRFWTFLPTFFRPRLLQAQPLAGGRVSKQLDKNGRAIAKFGFACPMVKFGRVFEPQGGKMVFPGGGLGVLGLSGVFWSNGLPSCNPIA